MKWLDKLEEAFIAVTLFTAALLVVVNIIIRMFGFGTMWSEELVRYMVIWITFVGVSYCVKKGGHISIELVPELLKGRSKFILNVLIHLICVLFGVLWTWYSTQFVYINYLYDQQSPALTLPVYLIYMVIPISGFFITLRYVIKTIKLFKVYQRQPDSQSENATQKQLIK